MLQYAGGVFCKLEAQWRAAYMQQQAKQQAQAQLRYSILLLLYLTITERSPYKSTKHVVKRGKSEVGKMIIFGGNPTFFIKLYIVGIY